MGFRLCRHFTIAGIPKFVGALWKPETTMTASSDLPRGTQRMNLVLKTLDAWVRQLIDTSGRKNRLHSTLRNGSSGLLPGSHTGPGPVREFLMGTHGRNANPLGRNRNHTNPRSIPSKDFW